jgi:hypothetical protein
MPATKALQITVRRCTALLLLVLSTLTMAYLRFLTVQGYDSQIDLVPIAFGLTALVFLGAIGYLLLSLGVVLLADGEKGTAAG